MKKSFILLLFFIPLISIGQNTNRDFEQKGKLFVKIYGGISPLLSDEFSLFSIPNRLDIKLDYSHDVGYNLGFSLGYFFTNNIALQAGFEKRRNRLFVPFDFFSPPNSPDLSTMLTTNSVYLNGLYYLQDKKKLRPYLGLGLSLLQDINYNIFEYDFSGTSVLGFKGIIGMDYHISSNIAFNLELNYNAFNEIEVEEGIGTEIKLRYNPLTVNLGIIYSFKLSSK